MTNREFYAIVANANISEEVTKFAKEAESKLDARNEKRRNTPTKAQEANATLRADMVKFITENGAKVAAEVAAEFAVSTQKASALLGQAVSAGEIKVADLKVKGKGTVKQYSALD